MDKKPGNTSDMQVSVNLDSTPILYTDSISMSINDFGVTMDILQRIGPSNQMRVVARVGMSREHAQKFIAELGKLLVVSETPVQNNNKRIH